MNQLFQKKRTSTAREAGTATTIIGEGIVLRGNLTKGDGTIRIDGTLEGDISVSGHLIIGETGRIHGSVSAESLLSGGEINGSIQARTEAHLTPSSNTKGDIRTESIIIEQGASIQGKIDTSVPHTLTASVSEIKVLDSAKESTAFSSARRIGTNPAVGISKKELDSEIEKAQ